MIGWERMLITQRKFAYGPTKSVDTKLFSYLPGTLKKASIPIRQTLRCKMEGSFLRMIATVSCLLLAITKVTRKLTTAENATSIPRQARNVNQNTTKPSLPKLPLGYFFHLECERLINSSRKNKN